jgi:cytochrome c5
MENEVHIPEHPSPIKTPAQLIVVVVLAFVVPVALILMIVQLIIGGLRTDPTHPGMDENAIAARIKPVGEVNFVVAGAAKTERSGEEVAKAVCTACHGAGLLGAPRIGDKGAWAARIGQGEKTLIAHALNGIRAMPPRGGSPDLSDVEVARASVWMANQSGGKLKEPTAPAAKPAATAPAASAAAAPAAQVAAPAGAKSGEQVYQATCNMCHGAGVAGAPKVGDKPAWTGRIAQGNATLHEHAIKGIRAMPAKGGNTSLSDADVKAAVDYMVARSK